MKNNKLLILALTASILSGCVKQVKDAFDETTEALTCANRVQEFEDTNEANPDRSCTAIIADIDDLERTCGDYLSESTKQSFADLRTACSAN